MVNHILRFCESENIVFHFELIESSRTLLCAYRNDERVRGVYIMRIKCKCWCIGYGDHNSVIALIPWSDMDDFRFENIELRKQKGIELVTGCVILLQ